MVQYLTFYTIIDVIVFAISLITLLNDRYWVWRCFIFFLFINVAIELCGIPSRKAYLQNPIPQNSNAWMYNILLVIRVGFCSAIFNHLLKRYINSSKLLIFNGLAIFLLSYLYNWMVNNPDGILDYNDFAESVASVIFILYSLFYYYLLLRDNKYVTLAYYTPFWWVTGVLFFYFGSIACTIYYNTLVRESSKSIINLKYVSYFLIVILYGCWSYSFICKRWLSKQE